MFKKTTVIILLIMYFISAIVPFLINIFFLREHDFGLIFIIDLLCFIIFLFFTVVFATTIGIKKGILLVSLYSISILLFYFSSLSIQRNAADHLFYYKREEKLNAFANEINSYKKIYALEERWYGVWLNDAHLNQKDLGKEKYNDTLKQTLNELDVEPEIFEKFKRNLKELGFLRLCRKDDGNIYFLTDDDHTEFGIAYSRTGIQTEDTFCRGRFAKWYKISGDWYGFITD